MGVSVEWAVCVAILLRLLDEAVSHIAGSHTSPAFIFSSTNDRRSRGLLRKQVERRRARNIKQKIGGNLSIAAYLRREAPPKTTNPNLNK